MTPAIVLVWTGRKICGRGVVRSDACMGYSFTLKWSIIYIESGADVCMQICRCMHVSTSPLWHGIKITVSARQCKIPALLHYLHPPDRAFCHCTPCGLCHPGRPSLKERLEKKRTGSPSSSR